MTSANPRLPAIFFGHGNPMNALGNNAYASAWSGLGARLPRPRAVLCISAHWYLPQLAVTAMRQPRTIHDFGGFPRELSAVQYPAPGDPALARKVQQLLAPLDVVLGAAHADDAIEFPVEGMGGGSVSMLAVQLG